ncbi:MAG: hypothetical protein R6U52_00195 [Kosmotogaceae bacterium]
MKKTNFLILIIVFLTLTVSSFSMPVSNLTYYTTDNWSVNFRIPFTDSFGVEMSLNNGQPYLGVVLFSSWEEFSEGFIKMKLRDGFFLLSASMGKDKAVLFTRYVSTSYQLPFYYHTNNEILLTTRAEYRILNKTQFRMGLGELTLGGNILNLSSREFAFREFSAYSKIKSWDKVFRLKASSNFILASIDLQSEGSLGEFGYGPGVSISYEPLEIGLCANMVQIIKLKPSNMVISGYLTASLSGIGLQISGWSLGNKDEILFGLESANLSDFNAFVRLSF